MRILPSTVLQQISFKKSVLAALTVAAVLLSSPVQAQSKVLDKANELYKASQYADAAELYRQALQQMENDGKGGRNALNVKTKLAYCYRMNNKMDKAEALYAQVVQDENAKADSYYYYGEALMSNGKYAEAKKWLLDYQKLEPTDEKAPLMIRACDYIPFIQPYFQYLDIQEFAYNSPADDNAPLAWQGGILFSSDREQGARLLKEKSGWTGRDYLNLYFSEKKPNGGFGAPSQFSAKLSEVNKNTGNASITADGSEIFFTRNDNVLNKQNTYSLQIYAAKSAGTDRWKDVEKLPFCSSNNNFMHPAVSPDGKLLFFASNRAGGFGGTDLWVSERNRGGEWGKPENLGAAVNTSVNEGFPFVGADSKLYFCSKGHPGYGGFDIFLTEKDVNGSWLPATNLGKPVNTPLDDISIYVAPDRRSGMFTSSRDGGDDDIYLFTVLDEAPAAEPTELISFQEETKAEAPAEPVFIKNKEEAKSNVEPAPAEVIAEPEKPAEMAPAPVVEKVQPPAPAPAKMEEPKVEKPAEAVVEKPVETAKPKPKPVQPEEAVANIREMPPVVPAPAQEMVQLTTLHDFSSKLEDGSLAIGERFRLDGAIYDPGVWQLTPRIIAPLDRLVGQMKANLSIQIEISSHTEALGVDAENLRLSTNRVEMVADYLLREGIDKNRIVAKGCGETMPLNHCRNGANCSMAEHLFNQRLEIKVLAVDGKW
ncbi:MAG: PD40 domain-containing protein [Bacteroidetes bacterium]|nr:PD40 domain-containing protein [Bacteroidota bacterium]